MGVELAAKDNNIHCKKYLYSVFICVENDLESLTQEKRAIRAIWTEIAEQAR